jgi:hypothetical protein
LVNFVGPGIPGVISYLSQMIQAQRHRDELFSDLLQTMEDSYAFVTRADELRDNPVLQDIAQQILNQTIECGFFILEYTRITFGCMYSTVRSCRGLTRSG